MMEQQEEEVLPLQVSVECTFKRFSLGDNGVFVLSFEIPASHLAHAMHFPLFIGKEKALATVYWKDDEQKKKATIGFAAFHKLTINKGADSLVSLEGEAAGAALEKLPKLLNKSVKLVLLEQAAQHEEGTADEE